MYLTFTLRTEMMLLMIGKRD